MHSHTLKIVLLLAVSVNQFTGGLSCCCLPRLLASSLFSALRPTVPFEVAPPQSASKTACPKCCRPRIESKSAASVVRNTSRKSQTTKISGDGHCNCVQLIAICILKEESIGERDLAQVQPAIPCFLEEYYSSTRPGIVKTSYSPPLFHRPDGRSWQSLACIWIA